MVLVAKVDHVNVIVNHALVCIHRIKRSYLIFLFLLDENTSCGASCSCTACKCNA